MWKNEDPWWQQKAAGCFKLDSICIQSKGTHNASQTVLVDIGRWLKSQSFLFIWVHVDINHLSIGLLIINTRRARKTPFFVRSEKCISR